MKYTKEIMEAACSGAKSIAQVCRNLGLKPVGGNYKTVKNNLEKFGIDTSHFTGQRWNKGLKFFEKTAIIPLEDILKPNVKYSSSVLRERLIACGLKQPICEVCGYTENLELHHINGDHYDNRIENLQILCPNCHAKTDNYRGRNTTKNSTPQSLSRKNSKDHYCTCKNCGKEFYSDRTDRVRKFCSRECYNEYLKKVKLGQSEPLQSCSNGQINKCDLSLKSLQEQTKLCTSIQQIADNLGSNTTTIRNYLKEYGLYEDFKLKYDFHSLIVIQYDINGNKLREFPSLTDAAEFVGLSGTSGIAKCCKGKRRSAGGYLWRYKEL